MAQIKTNLQYGVTGSLQTANIGNNQITNALMADDAIGLAEMASGTDGNIITYDASGNPAVVASGTAGHFLKSQGANTVPVFAAAAGGKVLQVVGMNTTTVATNNTSTYADTGVTVDITPSATSSKVLVIATIQGLIRQSGNTGSGAILQLLRDTTALGGLAYSGYDGVSITRYMSTVSWSYLDSPSSTSALTYKIQFKNNANAAGIQVQAGGLAGSQIICMEIDGS